MFSARYDAKVYSFNDFKYIYYIKGKDKAVKKIFAELLEIKKLKAFCRKLGKKDIDLKKGDIVLRGHKKTSHNWRKLICKMFLFFI
ncbi:hypothetical protein [Listeria innocua]|uniref:hypothetical protein n=1 Tax=Listeria innocua TaxID=1642 RepID=UPI00052E8E50|nr:hypothetical protein [Listeria innocua]NTU41144.1 hypothetical protein [Listeria innocua]REA95163.1 hypothetical protein C1N35_13345 [Listeria innocua]WIH34742.1 hypothetical protein MZN45_04035 [Listeria innocua]